MKIIFLGATKFSEEILFHLLDNGISIELLLTIPREFTISYSEQKVVNFNYSDLPALAAAKSITCLHVDSGDGKKISDYESQIREIDPDVILVMGWYYMVPKKIRDLAKYGAWGIHASLLPDYAGGAPLVWAIIEGQKKTGVTLFRLDDGVDDGDIISQAEISIDENDTIKEVYQKATEMAKKILLHSLNNIESVEFKPQDKSKIRVYPQRKPDDGEINLLWPSSKMYDFIRAQAPPYPGAFIRTSDNKKLIIEKARIIN